MRDERGAQSRIDDIVDGNTRNEIANYDLIELVRFSGRVFEISEELEDMVDMKKLTEINVGREKIAEAILKKSSEITPEFGVELIDVKFKRINYVEKVRQKVFSRMIAERERIASKYRSEGDGRSNEISGQTEKELKSIQSEAYKTAQEIKGKADAEATSIYAAAYNLDPDFYSFMRTLETYRNTIDSTSTYVMTTDSDYLKYLKEAK